MPKTCTAVRLTSDFKLLSTTKPWWQGLLIEIKTSKRNASSSKLKKKLQECEEWLTWIMVTTSQETITRMWNHNIKNKSMIKSHSTCRLSSNSGARCTTSKAFLTDHKVAQTEITVAPEDCEYLNETASFCWKYSRNIKSLRNSCVHLLLNVGFHCAPAIFSAKWGW